MNILRVALYSGLIFERDAVSRSLLWKLRLFQRLKDEGYPIDVTVFTQATDFHDPEISVVPHVGALIRDARFDEADLHIFEYGMPYDLFNALFLTDRPTLVVDHNTTPIEMVRDPMSKLACSKAIAERHNLTRATWVAADSEFTRNELLDLDFDADRLSVLHLPPSNCSIGRSEHSFASPLRKDLVRALYVGRLVKSKGINELLSAMLKLWDGGEREIQLTIAGTVRFSDPETIAQIAEVLLEHEVEGRLRLVLDADDDEIAALFGESDLFVMPSHHEGYCIPVIEAMQSGCFVIGCDAGNVRTIMGGLGELYAPGDVDGLAVHINDFVQRLRASRDGHGELVLSTEAGDIPLHQWHAAVERHLSEYSQEHYERSLLRVLEDVLREGGTDVPVWLTNMADGAQSTPLQPA